MIIVNQNLKKKIIKFREDELSHKDIAYEKGCYKRRSILYIR